MWVTVRDVLRRPELQLRLVAEATPAAREAVVTWVVSSDLSDPTPFLDRGNLLLTTGRQFDPRVTGDADGDQRYTDDADSYIAGLCRKGVSAVGFGIRVLHTGTPPALVEACRTHGMPLFEVPYHIPFLAVIRAAADMIDAAGHRRAGWALAGTRAISAAAMRTSPVDAVLGELGRQSGRGVVLVDARGRVRTVHGMASTDPIVTAARDEAARLLDRGKRAGATVTVPNPSPQLNRSRKSPVGDGAARSVLAMQTIGPDGGLRGVLVLAGITGIDSAEQTMVSSVGALLWFALGERVGQTSMRTTLQRALWHILLEGDVDFVRIAAPSAGMRLPEEPVRAVVWSPGSSEPILRALHAMVDDGRPVVFATVDGSVRACVGGDEVSHLAGVDSTRGVGISEPVRYQDLPGAVERSFRVARRTPPGSLVALDDPVAGGLTALITTPDLVDLAQGLLHPLIDQDESTHSGLLPALTAWLKANGSYEAAARTLGLHRHTLTARVKRAATLVRRDLDDADARMELWLALRLTGRV